MDKLIFEIKRFFWLFAVFFVRIVFAKRNFKVPYLKSLYYNINGGFTSDQVALYDLNKTNKKEYLSEFDWYKSRKINYPNSYKLNNKLICAEMLKDIVYVPKTVLKKESGILSLDNNNKITEEEAIATLKKEKSLFFKPISIGKGIGIFRLDYKNNKFYINFKEVSEEKLKELLKTRDDYFISSRIAQSEYLDNIYEKTSNTIRLITVRENNKVKILFAVQRLGTKETIPVDNGSKGGLVANINLDTGKLSKAKSIHNNIEYEKHPDSNKTIEGVIVPNWETIKKEMLKAAEKLPEFKFIAWDLLPSDNEFYVLEANNSSGVNIIQVFGGQRNKELGNFYKQEKIIK